VALQPDDAISIEPINAAHKILFIIANFLHEFDRIIHRGPTTAFDPFALGISDSLSRPYNPAHASERYSHNHPMLQGLKPQVLEDFNPPDPPAKNLEYAPHIHEDANTRYLVWGIILASGYVSYCTPGAGSDFNTATDDINQDYPRNSRQQTDHCQ
jgi:hypothetical protein